MVLSIVPGVDPGVAEGVACGECRLNDTGSPFISSRPLGVGFGKRGVVLAPPQRGRRLFTSNDVVLWAIMTCWLRRAPNVVEDSLSQCL